MYQKMLQRTGAWILAFLMLLGAAQWPSIQLKAAETENSARNAAATASSTETADFSADKVIDGDRTSKASRWASKRGAGPEWLQLTWAKEQTIKNILLFWERRNVEDYRLEVSSDGTEWETVYENESYPSKNNETIALDQAVTAKSLRLYINKVNSASADPNETAWDTASLYEVEVYADEVPDSRTELEKLVDSISAPGEVKKGDKKISMPENMPEGAKVRFCADYEQVIGEDGTIYAPLEDKDVKGFYEVTLADGSSAKTDEFTVAVPGLHDADDALNAKPAVIPELQEWHGATGTFAASKGRVVLGSSELRAVADEFAKDYKDVMGLDIAVVEGTRSDARIGDFYLSLAEEGNGLGKEGYALEVDNAVFAEAEQATGAYWATRTILQILKMTNGTIPKGLVRDYPKYEVRGFSLDVGRKPFTMDALYEFSKNMSWYKMNSFQVHLSDNLIFHEDYATLEDAIEHSYAGNRLESGVVNEETGKSSTADDVFYTKEEFRDFIKYSRLMGVDVVPEFDMPAHALPFTRAFPEFMTAKAGGSHGYLIEELNLEKEGVIPWAQSIWADYFEGNDPVFDEDVTIHIGTDEYHGTEGQQGKELFRQFSDAMIEYVQGTGRTVRMWGSLSNKAGTTPVRSDGVQLNIWNTGYADPKNMYNLGFDLINTLESPNYIVPAAGYYSNYINTQHIYSNWQPNVIGNLTASAGDDQILGACYAIWHDSVDTRANGISEYDSFDRFFKAVPAYGAKLWGDAKDRDYKEFTKVAEKAGTAPNTNMYGEVDYVTSTIANYTFKETTKDSSENGFDLSAPVKADWADGENGKALRLNGGESYAETPDALDLIGSGATLTMKVKKDAGAGEGEQILCESKSVFGAYGTYAFKAVQKNTGKVGYSREGYDFSFDYTLPEGEWVTLTFQSGQDTVALYVNGELVDNDPEIYFANHPTTELSAKLSKHNITKTATMLVPFGRIGSKSNSFKGLIELVSVTGAKKTSGEYKKIPKEGWTAEACSTSPAEGSKEAVYDDDGASYWHQDYNDDVYSDKLNEDEDHTHWFKLVLPEAQEIDRLTYLPRQDSANGRIFLYSIKVTKEDGTEETVVDRAEWANDSSLKQATFQPIRAKEVNLLIHKASGGHATIAELSLYEPSDMAVIRAEMAALLSKYATYEELIYTEVSWSAFTKAKEALEQMMAYEGATEDDCVYVIEKFNEAMGRLTEKSKEHLTLNLSEAVGSANEFMSNKTETDKYTAESLLLYQNAYQKAQDVLKDENATYQEIKDALAALQNVALVTKASAEKASLMAAVAVAEAQLKNTAGYTAESVKALQDAVAAAKAVLAKENASYEELTAALTKLKGTALKKEEESGTDEFTSGGATYKVTNTSKKEVSLIKGKNAKKFKIPATVKDSSKVSYKVTAVADNAFKSCKKLTEVTFGKNVKSIGKNSFQKLSKLGSIIFQNTKAPKIGKNAFKGIKAKVKVSYPKKMKGKELKALKANMKKAGVGKRVTYKKK